MVRLSWQYVISLFGTNNLSTTLSWCHGVVDSTCDTEYDWHGFDSQPYKYQHAGVSGLN